MKRPPSRIALGLGVVAIAGLALASAVQAATPSKSSCFFSSSWEGWKSPKPDLIYLRVNLHDIYRVDLESGSPRLQWPDSHLVNKIRGSNVICSPLDLDLAVADTSGFPEHLFVKTIAKLTPDEVAAIPKKDLP